jgi:hypothetical protein
MRYGFYTAIFVLVFCAGSYCGYKFFPRQVVSTVPGPERLRETVRTVIKTKEGSTTETITTREVEKPSTHKNSKSQFRLGALLPIGEPKDVSVTAARRVVGSVWVDANYNIRTREVLLGVSVEF